MANLHAISGPEPGDLEADNVKRRQAWLEANPGATIEADDHGWHVAKSKAGILLGRRPELGDLMDRLEAW